MTTLTGDQLLLARTLFETKPHHSSYLMNQWHNDVGGIAAAFNNAHRDEFDAMRFIEIANTGVIELDDITGGDGNEDE